MDAIASPDALSGDSPPQRNAIRRKEQWQSMNKKTDQKGVLQHGYAR